MSSVAVATKRTFSTMMGDTSRIQGWSPSESRTARQRAAGYGVTDSAVSSTMSTPRTTPTPIPPLVEGRRIFDPSASIVLVGIRGTGKSTLAIMASMACRRRVVDVEQQFQEATGFSTAKYRKQFGASNHNLRQEELLRNTLHAYSKGAIIVCNGGSLERSGQVLLQEFAQSHPVIHIMRDISSVHRYLEVLPMSKLQSLVEFTAPIFRRCSNYEFYNISETKAAISVVPANQPSVPAFLTLKRAERTFLKFLSLITSPTEKQGACRDVSASFEPAFPLSEVPVELRKYTCAVQVPMIDLVDDVDIEELEFGSDAFEVVVEPVHMDPHLEHLPSERAEQISSVISKVRRSTIVPLIYHVTPVTEQRLTSSYLEHVRHGLRTAPEFITIDLSLDEGYVREMIASRGLSKIVGHLHAPLDWYDVFWLNKYEAAVRLGCSAVRFTRPAHFMDDNAAIQTFRNEIRKKVETIPLICYNTGRAGRRSACFNQVLTSVIPETVRDSTAFASRIEHNPETSWLTVKEASHVLYASFTYDPMRFYIIGASAGYSLSPAMHNAAYKVYGMPHCFETYQTSTLNTLQELVQDVNFGGTAVTQPFKLEVISLVHSMSRHARAIGAVNTLIPVRHLSEDGSIPADLDMFTERNQAGPIKALYGDNTDWIGIKSCIRRGLSPANAVRPTTCGLVIGSGGMARAAVYAMLQIGVKNIVVFNRTYANAEKLVAHFDRLVSSSASSGLLPLTSQTPRPTFRIVESREDAWPTGLRPPSIVLSCIPTHPVGDAPKPSFTLPTQWMHSPTGGVVIELAYRTLNTPLMKQIREETSGGWVCLDGLDLLPEQGFAQFEMFTGKRAPRRAMREEVLRSWRDEQGQADPVMVQTRLEAIGGEP
jgi:shikimate 5-dehydrogenase/shikimate kinase